MINLITKHSTFKMFVIQISHYPSKKISMSVCLTDCQSQVRVVPLLVSTRREWLILEKICSGMWYGENVCILLEVQLTLINKLRGQIGGYGSWSYTNEILAKAEFIKFTYVCGSLCIHSKELSVNAL